VLDLLHDPSRYWKIFPRLRSARVVGEMPPDWLIEFTYGGSFIESTHTLRVRFEKGSSEVRFWLDPQRAHGIRDAWGFFRIEPVAGEPASGDRPRVLFTFAILVDLGGGMLDPLIEGRVERLMFRVPDLVRAEFRR
jgi:hypothetical protein